MTITLAASAAMSNARASAADATTQPAGAAGNACCATSQPAGDAAGKSCCAKPAASQPADAAAGKSCCAAKAAKPADKACCATSQPGDAAKACCAGADASKPASQPATSQPASEPAGPPEVIITTSMGEIRVKLWPELAPLTVKNFLAYTDAEFYDGTIFHRVIKGFMVQGGGFTPDMDQKPTKAPVRNEASAAARNRRGTLAMARTSDVDSATAQFFINHADNDFLDHRDRTARGFGYAAFGEVVSGMDVVDKIAAVQTKTVGPFGDVPAQPVTILSVRRAN